MILQALYDYYERKAAGPNPSIAPIGFARKDIPFVIVIDRNGLFVDLQDTREKRGKKMVAREYLLPIAKSRTGTAAWKIAFLLWDHYGYILGYPDNKTQKDRDIGAKRLNTFIDTLDSLPEKIRRDDGVNAVINFYEKKEHLRVFQCPTWGDCKAIKRCNLTFRLVGEGYTIAERPVIIDYQQRTTLLPEKGEETEALCLITGKRGIIQRIHGATPIEGSEANAKIVGLQEKSGYDSYGKFRGFNAPIGKYAHVAYITAVNTLLSQDSKIVLGGKDLPHAVVVFWSAKPSKFEQDFNLFFCEPSDGDDPDKGIRAVRSLYQSIQTGSWAAESANSFFVLGLAPNAGRISVRFWSTGSVLNYAEKIKAHFDDLEIIKSDSDQEFYSLHKLLSCTALEYKIGNVPPNLAGAVVQAILAGTPYPTTLLQQCIRRIRAERKVNRIRAAILKACINRQRRYLKTTTGEGISVSLDKNSLNPAYRLGRLFAVLENIQKRAQGKGTIRERFYGAASSSPVTVFPQLLKLKNHHLAKLTDGNVAYFENILAEIFAGITDIPSHLPLQAQAMFAVGYYHQRQDLFTKNEDKE